MKLDRSRKAAAGLSLILYSFVPVAADAAETVSYSYDELGRLIQTSKSGGPATGAQTTTTFDPAGNRTNQTTTGAPPAPPPPP